MQTQNQINKVDTKDDWNLTTDQMFFLMQLHNPIQEAHASDNMAYLDSIEKSAVYHSLFGDMRFDEAMDRYKCMLDEDSEDDVKVS